MIKLLYHLIKNHGWSYVYHRIVYELQKKWSSQKKIFPKNPENRLFINLEQWKVLNPPFFFQSRAEVNIPLSPTENLKSSYEKIRKGYLLFFNQNWKQIGIEYDWVTHPLTGYKYDISKHWTKISDFTKESGDIKYVWEKSRFSYLYAIIRYDHHFEEDSSGFVFDQICDWIEKNPINQGPNYRCSQEISLRIFNWIFALYFYKNSSLLTDAVFHKILNSIYWQLHHVRNNIHFSRKFVRNNHAITETALLYLSGFLFPFFDHVDRWSTEGKEWLQQELIYQIAEDGTFIQHSHNYHRVLLQLLSWVLYLSEKNSDSLNSKVLTRSKAAVEYLKNMIHSGDGEVPNYGPNDGALFFPLSDCDYSDFRPSVNATYYYFNRSPLFNDHLIVEELQWYGADVSSEFLADKKIRGLKKFDDGGIYTFTERDAFTFIKCSDNQHRPYQSDNLHLDIWYKGINIIRDAGSYLYNTDRETESFFISGKAHNTITVGGVDQMERGPRFIWFNWSKAELLDFRENDESFFFKGKMVGFQSLGSNIVVSREVTKRKGLPIWEVLDQLENGGDFQLSQWWHPNPEYKNKITIKGTSGEKTVSCEELQGYYSGYYGHREASPVLKFSSSDGCIYTVIEFELG